MKKLLLGALMLSTVSSFAQTKKVIIEDYTGLKCGWCPEGTVILEGLHTANPTNCLPVAVHGGGYEPASSPLKSTEAEAVITFVAPSGYPAGSIDRKMFSGETKVAVTRSKWSTYFNQQAATTAIVSIGFANKKYDPVSKEYTADVNVQFSSAPTGPVSLQVYAIEDSIPATGALAQDNYSSAVQGGASPLNPWFHNRTFRKMLAGSSWIGDIATIPATPASNVKYTYKLKFTMGTTWNKNQVHLIAYVANNTSNNREILNAEESHSVGKTFWPTGINEMTKNVELISAFPNPANLNDIVKIQYHTTHSTEVSMKVFNIVGQLVAQPYTSREVEGSHVINWRPSESNLKAGIYLIEVSTQYGKEVQRISIH